jgi:hypothetical protein
MIHTVNTIHNGPTHNNWSPRLLTLHDGTEVTVLAAPDANENITYVLPTAPSLVYRSTGEPLLSLSLVLSSQPAPNEQSVHPLIEHGVLTMDVQVGVPMNVLDTLAASGEGTFRRLFARKVEYVLLWAENNDEPPFILARAEGSGTEGRAGISAHLNRAQSLDVLAALDDTPARLRLCATIHYRSVGAPQFVRLSGSWALIHDYLSTHVDEQGRLSEAALQRLILAMAEDGLLTITRADGSPAQLSAEPLLRLFMRQAMVVLRQEPQTNGSKAWYTLRSRPHPSFRLSYSETITGNHLQTHELCTSLDHLLGGALEGRNWDNYVHMVAKQPDNPALVLPVRRKVQATPGRHNRHSRSTNLKVAALNNSVTSLTTATLPSSNTIIRPNVVTPYKQGITINHGALDDLRLELPQKDQPRSLPVIHDPDASYWKDRLNSKKLWYAPDFEIVAPSPGSSVDNSPFLFSFERTGVTNTGQPALQGSVRFTLRQIMSKETTKALAPLLRKTKDGVHPVSLNNLTVVLLVPFVDTNNGKIKQHRFVAKVTQRGDTAIVTVSLLNEWVRLAYGALAIEGFQSSPAQIQIGYTFSGYVVAEEKDIEIAFGGKALHTPVFYAAEEAATQRATTYFDASTLTYVQPQQELHYLREKAITSRRTDRRAEAISLARPNVPLKQHVVTNLSAVRPQLTLKPDVLALLKQVEYATRTQVRRQKQDLLFPCNQFGRLYQEMRNSTPAAIGCQEALTLGQTRYRQYEEMSELRDSAYQVYRSLQQPGHFLVVPTHFCISRREASEIDSYRPLIFLHALLDVEVPDNNRVELRAVLQPDVPLFKRSALLERLKAYDPEPTINYPTDIPTEAVSFSWALDPTISASSEADILDASGPFISTYFHMGLASWQLMRSVLNNPGISGSVLFTLADGSELLSNLLLKLDYIRGPWESGPLQVTIDNGQVQLTNRIERTIDIDDLVRYAGSGVAQQIPVEVSLAAGQTHSMNTNDVLQPVYSYPPDDPIAIEEVRSFVEDIYSNLIFINLLNFANYNLVRLDIEARMEGVGNYTTQLDQDMPVADIPIVLPLTTYLEQRILEFRVNKVFENEDGERTEDLTEWMRWNLDTSTPISITSELLNL